MPATVIGVGWQRHTAAQAGAPAAGSVALQTERGATRIADSVVAKVAGLAARDIPWVFAMGTGMARRVAQMRSLRAGSSELPPRGSPPRWGSGRPRST